MLPKTIKPRFFLDSTLYGFATPTAYLRELIERGLPVSKSIETRLKAIEDKQDEFAGEMAKEVLTLQKRLYVTYRLAEKTLIHAVYMKPGPVTDEAVAEAKALCTSGKMWHTRLYILLGTDWMNVNFG